jgi:hypothetical protein
MASENQLGFVNPARGAFVYAAMPGMLVLAFFSVAIVLRATRGGMTGGILLMGFGVWMLWAGAVRHHDELYLLDSPPRIGSLLLGTWLVVKGVLRFSA